MCRTRSNKQCDAGVLPALSNAVSGFAFRSQFAEAGRFLQFEPNRPIARQLTIGSQSPATSLALQFKPNRPIAGPPLSRFAIRSQSSATRSLASQFEPTEPLAPSLRLKSCGDKARPAIRSQFAEAGPFCSSNPIRWRAPLTIRSQSPATRSTPSVRSCQGQTSHTQE